MSTYRTSLYNKNKTELFCAMDTQELWDKNSKKYLNDETTKYYQKNPIEYFFNNCGFRTPDDFNDKDEGNIFLGCSNTMGIGHLLENTWSYKLNKHIGGKFWNLSQGGSGTDTAFRLLYGFKDYLKVKNIFHLTTPSYHPFRYEFIINSKPILMNVLFDDGKYAKELLGDDFVENSLMNEDFAKLRYDKTMYAIKSLAKDMGCNYHVFVETEDVWNIKEDSSIGARDFVHMTIGQQNSIYESFLKIIEKKP
jgi:hypothetical protein